MPLSHTRYVWLSFHESHASSDDDRCPSRICLLFHRHLQLCVVGSVGELVIDAMTNLCSIVVDLLNNSMADAYVGHTCPHNSDMGLDHWVVTERFGGTYRHHAEILILAVEYSLRCGVAIWAVLHCADNDTSQLRSTLSLPLLAPLMDVYHGNCSLNQSTEVVYCHAGHHGRSSTSPYMRIHRNTW